MPGYKTPATILDNYKKIVGGDNIRRQNDIYVPQRNNGDNMDETKSYALRKLRMMKKKQMMNGGSGANSN